MIEEFHQSVAVLVKFVDGAKQLIIRLAAVAYDAFVRVAVGGSTLLSSGSLSMYLNQSQLTQTLDSMSANVKF
jgi:hypothetical protein